MFVGEYGMNRREFLYDIQMWEAHRIIRGRRRSKILQYQLQRLQVWASLFCLGNPEKKLPTDIIHLYFDDDEEDEPPPPISDEDRQELLNLIRMKNKEALEKEAEK